VAVCCGANAGVLYVLRHAQSVHVLGAYFLSLPDGAVPFVCTSPSGALELLRRMLLHLNIPEASQYRTHDLRRGHAEDLRCSGANLYEILKAGEWRSPAFLSYLDTNELESAAVIEAHVDDESDEDDVAVVSARGVKRGRGASGGVQTASAVLM